MKHLKKDPMYIFLIVLTIAVAVGLETWHTLFNNFAVEIAGLKGNHIGIIQSAREIPGFLTLLVVYVILVIREHRLASLSILILGIGVFLTGVFPSFIGVLITTLAMSFGFHYYETASQSLTLQYFDEGISPYVLGKQRSYGAAANIAVGVVILTMSSFFNYYLIYMSLGGLVIAMGIWGLSQNPSRADIIPQRKEMVFRKKYWLYYFLTFIAGARRQIFIVFAAFLLVEKFHYSIQEITILFVINNVINYFVSPLIGKWIIRFGERKILSIEYTGLILIFISYAFVNSRMILAVLYILDHVFFNFAIAILGAISLGSQIF